MKKSLVCLAGFFISVGLMAQSRKDDSIALEVLDRMSGVIGQLESCGFKLKTESDIKDYPYGLSKHFSEYEVYMSGPDKMLILGQGHKGHRQFVYNGQHMAYYSYDDHNYGLIPAPSTTLKAIDSVNKAYGFEFPAADFFYPAFTDDLVESTDSIKFIGMVTIEGKRYFHIIAFSKEFDLQFWINDDAYTLPGKFAFRYKNQEGNPQYVGSFSDWEINPKLPDAMFEFYPPPGSQVVRIMSKNEK
jgi:hypothetical protein